MTRFQDSICNEQENSTKCMCHNEKVFSAQFRMNRFFSRRIKMLLRLYSVLPDGNSNKMESKCLSGLQVGQKKKLFIQRIQAALARGESKR